MRNDIIAQAKAIRGSMDTVTATLTDEQALAVLHLYLPWKAGETVAAEDIRRRGGKLYRCLMGHTTQADWTPEASPALWVEIAPAGRYREIKAEMLPTEAFALGEIGWWLTEDNLYKSLIEGNVYTPDSYPAGWEKVVS